MLHLQASDRVRPLAAALADVLADPLADPMQYEWVAVPTEGMQRWLQLELARRLGASARGGDGVSANIRYPFPDALRAAVLRAGRDDDRDPWKVDQLVWSVLDALHAHRDDERLGPLTALPAGATWYGRARRLADLFDRYALWRPELLRRWQRDRDVDAAGNPLDAADRWQPHLWRLVRATVGTPSPPERLPELLAALRDGSLPVELPPRLALFGVTTLPGGAPFLELAEAIGIHRHLHLFLLDPSRAAMERVDAAARAGVPDPGRLRGEDGTGPAVHHPLLRSWGRPYRERTVLLATEDPDLTPEWLDAPLEPDPPPTLLARLRADLRADTAPAGDHQLAGDDRSVQVHSCHGPARQVEVLRDAILHLLADDPTLREDDIVVLSPAVEDFLPWIEAGFGKPAGDGDDPDPAARPRLAYRVADRSLRDSSPLLTAVDTLLELLAGRFTASAVLEFLALGPVQDRFDLDDDALGVAARWVAATNVRWGLDGEHRAAWGIPAVYTANSWAAALDRLLLGVAVGDDDTALAAGGIAPLGVEGGEITTLGRLADVLTHLADLAGEAARLRDAGAWCDWVLDASTRLFAVDGAHQWQLDRLQRVLAEIRDDAAADDGEPVLLGLADVRRLLADRFEGVPRRPDFFRGGITITSLTPLRWLPFRVVCLLGLDEGALSTRAADGDDLAVRAPLLGDRDPRAELRQALLEAVLAAEEHLVVTRTGHNVLTNREVPESVAVAELRDTVVATLAGDGQRIYGQRIEVQHPHQPFDPRNFRPGALRPGPWSFDPTALAGARVDVPRAGAPTALVDAPLPDRAGEDTVVTLAELQAFLNHPAKAFLTRRLGLSFPREEAELSDHLPTVVEGLDAWQVAQRLLDARAAGVTTDEWKAHELACGTLPPGGLGDLRIGMIIDAVEEILEQAAELGVEPRPQDPSPIDVRLPDGTRLVGTIERRCGELCPGPARLSYSKAQPKQELAAWLDLMALVADDPESDWRSVLVRRDRNAKPDSWKIDALELVPRGGTAAARHELACRALGLVVDLWRRGQREPVPLFSKLSKRLADGEPVSTSDWSITGWFNEGQDEANVLAFGAVDVAELTGARARPDDPPGRSPYRCRRFAEYLWGVVEESSWTAARAAEAAAAQPALEAAR